MGSEGGEELGQYMGIEETGQIQLARIICSTVCPELNMPHVWYVDLYGMYILYAVDDHCCIVTVAVFHAYGTAAESISAILHASVYMLLFNMLLT